MVRKKRFLCPCGYDRDMNEKKTSAECPSAWAAPTMRKPINATVRIPGSKSLSNRYLILAALGRKPVKLDAILRSRDTDLMMQALRNLGVKCEQSKSDPTCVTVIPPSDGRFKGDTDVYCGLAGTVMRFVPALALFADGPVRFDGDEQAYRRPMKPLLDGLIQAGARIEYRGQEGRLPFTVYPRGYEGSESGSESGSDRVEISIDSSASSQFISGLLLAASRFDRPAVIRHAGEKLPSMPHIRMTVEDLRIAGINVDFDAKTNSWTVNACDSADTEERADADGCDDAVRTGKRAGKVCLPERVIIEPDLSNAAPFLAAALIAGGTVSIPNWPFETTQPGGLLPGYLQRMGAEVSYRTLTDGSQTISVTGNGKIRGVGDLDMSAAGEIAPSIAALCVLADSETSLKGIGHLRGHETDRLAALETEIRRIGGKAGQLDDGIEIIPVKRESLHGETMATYADHRMATFAAMLGLAVENIRIENVETTRKTIPDFTGMWLKMLNMSETDSTVCQSSDSACSDSACSGSACSGSACSGSECSAAERLADSPFKNDLQLALLMADKADEISVSRFGAMNLKIETKPDNTPVTDADREIETAIRDMISRLSAGDDVYGEEFGKDECRLRRWIIDPIDGTKNFIRGVPVWATLIALQVGEEIVVGVVSAPALNSRWFAVKGAGAYKGRSIRSCEPVGVSRVSKLSDASLSFSSLSGWRDCSKREQLISLTDDVWRVRGFGDFWQYMLLAQGSVDIAAEPELDLYDMAALVPIVVEAGGKFTDLSGKPGPWGGNAVATNSLLHNEVLKRLNG